MSTVAVGNRYNIKTLQRAYPTVGTDKFSLVNSNTQVFLHSFLAYNAGAVGDVGLGVALAPAAWKFYVGAVKTGSPALSNVTATVQAGSAVDAFTTTNDDGFLVASSKPFGYLTLNISQAQTGSPVYVYEYWNGSAWAVLTTSQSPAYTGTGIVHLTFNPPPDWVAGDGGLGPNNAYAIRAYASTAPTQAVKLNSVRVGYWFCYRKTVQAGGQVSVSFDMHPLLLESGEALVPYFSSANSTNSIEAAYQQAP